MPSGKNSRRRRATGLSQQESTGIAGQAALVTRSSLSTQPLTPPPSPSTRANERPGSSQPQSLFQSRDLVINDGQFNQTRGHHTNLVINFNQSASGSPSDSPSGSPRSNETDHTNLGPSSGQSTQHNHERVGRQAEVLSQSQEIPLQKSNDIYERHLTLKGRGFPLWIPEANQVLHINYRRTGVHIGDVGIITHDGGFSFLFNICLPRDDPVNPRVLPEHFAPISPPIEATDIEKFLVFKNGSHLASASIKRSQNNPAISGIVFESSASEGAILTMPRGARSEDLGNFAKFREYAAANVADWYKFVNGPRGREAKNGDVRLVVGFDKTTSWGIATFANQTQQQNSCRLRFGPSEGGLTASASTYAWEYSGAAEVRAGPDSDENDELRRDGDPPGIQFENQCLFMRTLNVTLADDVWTDIHSSLGSVHVSSRNKQYPPVKDYSDPNHPHSNNPGTSSSSNSLPSQGAQSGTQRTTGSQMRDSDTASDDVPAMFISGPLESLTAHPSKVLNDILLAKVPTAKVVITHDDDWSSIITQYDTLPDPHEMTAKILASHNICEEDGVIFLQPKEIANEMSEGSARVQVSEVVMADSDSTGTETPFNKDNLTVFAAFIFSVQLSPYKDAFPALPRFFFFDSAQDLISFNISQYSKGFDLGEPLEKLMAKISFSFLITLDTVRDLSELLLGAGLLEDAEDPLCYDFDDEAEYQFTCLGLDSLNRFLHENSDLQNYLKSSLGVTSTQTIAVPLSVVAFMGGQHFMQAGLIEDAQNILSTTFSDGRVYQFTAKYFALVVTFPSRRRAEEGDDDVITLFQSARKQRTVTDPLSPVRVGDAPNEDHPQQHEKHDDLPHSRSQPHLVAPASSSPDHDQSTPNQQSSLISPTTRSHSQERASPSRRVLSRSLELAREAVRIDSAGEQPEAAFNAYAQSVALLSGLMEKVRNGEDNIDHHERRRPGSVAEQKKDLMRLQSIHDTYAERMDILSIIHTKRSPIACMNCRMHKVECRSFQSVENNPCERCVKRQILCEYRHVDQDLALSSLVPSKLSTQDPIATPSQYDSDEHSVTESIATLHPLHLQTNDEDNDDHNYYQADEDIMTQSIPLPPQRDPPGYKLLSGMLIRKRDNYKQTSKETTNASDSRVNSRIVQGSSHDDTTKTTTPIIGWGTRLASTLRRKSVKGDRDRDQDDGNTRSGSPTFSVVESVDSSISRPNSLFSYASSLSSRSSISSSSDSLDSKSSKFKAALTSFNTLGSTFTGAARKPLSVGIYDDRVLSKKQATTEMEGKIMGENQEEFESVEQDTNRNSKAQMNNLLPVSGSSFVDNSAGVVNTALYAVVEEDEETEYSADGEEGEEEAKEQWTREMAWL